MKTENEALNSFCQQMIAYRLPRWEELPAFDIYMDQMITLVKQYVKDLFDEDDVIITNSMINNYVKMGMIPKPVKKRYNRVHIAYLLAITLIKQVLTISQVKDGIDYQIAQLGPKGAFNMFCDEQENALRMIGTQVLEKQTEKVNEYLMSFHRDNVPIRLITLAFASRLVAKKMVTLSNQRKEDTEIRGSPEPLFFYHKEEAQDEGTVFEPDEGIFGK